MDEKIENKLFYGIAFIIIMTTILLIFSEFTSGLKINEIMFNPSGSDTGREWIEIYAEYADSNESCINLSQYKLFEENSNHNIYAYNQINNQQNNLNCGYSIICSNCDYFLNEYDEYGTFLNQTIPLYKSSFSLSNSGELIALKLNESIIDEINYLNFTNISEGYSLELYNYSWRQSLNISGSPGLASPIAGILENNITLNYTSNETLNITSNITNNVTQNYTTNTSINITINTTNYCNISINITLKNTSIDIFNNKESIKFYNKIYDAGYGGTYAYSIEYWIEDLFENTVKSKTTTTNQNEKSYTPSIYEEDRILIIKNKLNIEGCTNIGKNESSRFLMIKNNNYVEEECEEESVSSIIESNDLDMLQESLINITKIEIKLIKEINKLTASTYIYKGNSRKSVINIAIVDEKNKTIENYKLKLNEKYSSMNFDFEKELDCLPNKTFYLIAEGLNNSVKEQLNLSCQETSDKTTLNTSNKISSTNQLSNANSQTTENVSLKTASQITGQTIYESPNQKNKIYSFIGLVLLCLAGISFLGYKVYGLYIRRNEVINEDIKVDKNEEYEKTPI